MPGSSVSSVIRTFIAAALVLLAAPTGAETILHRGNRFEPASLDPHKTQTHYEAAVQLDLFEGLTAYDAEARPQPGVAERWQTSADGRTWTFTLRDGLAWSDGAALTAHDVVFSLRRLVDPATAAQYAQLMYIVKGARAVNTGAAPVETLGVAAPDARTVVLELSEPAPYLPELLANPFAVVLPAHAIARAGADWVKPGAMASNGAFTLTAWEPQSRIVLARNPRYRAAGQVKLDGVVYYPTADLSAAVSRFRAGELDMQFEFPTAQIDLLRNELAAETRISPALLTYYLAFNTTNPKLADARVRRALSMAVDRDVLTQRILRTGEVPAVSFVPPATANYRPAAMDFAGWPSEQRLAQARALLAEAGYGPGNPLTLVYSHSSNEDLRRIGVAVAAMWRRVGVATELMNREGRVHFASLKSGDFEVGFVGWSADFNDAATFLYVLQSTTVNSNYARFRNADFDRLMAAAAAEPDAAKRAGLLHEAEAIAMAEQPIAPLYVGVTKNLVSKAVTGFADNPIDFHLSRFLSVAR